MVSISDDFVSRYADKTPPWGFGGMGEVVFLRTYSRKKDNGEQETWPETIQRVINGAIDVGVPYTQDDAEALFDHMFNLRCSLSGRALWQLGTPLVQRLNAASLNNCFTADTNIITRDGVRTLGELAGGDVELLTEKGWRTAPVNSFGRQDVNMVTFRPAHRNTHNPEYWTATRSNVRMTEKATPNHRWILTDGTITENLQVGDIVKSGRTEDIGFNPEAFIHGFVFGDGTVAYQRQDGTLVHRIRLCGEKDIRWLSLFEENGWRRIKDAPNGDPILVADSTVALKSLPSNPTADYASNFIEGWCAADGTLKDNGDWWLCSQHDEAEEWLTKHAAMGGFLLVGGCKGSSDTTNYGDRSSELRRYTLTRDERAWKVESIEPYGVEEVYCPTVPELESFTLASGIYTLNCYFVNIETIKDFEFLFDHLMLGGGVGFSVERAKIHELPKVKDGVEIVHENTKDADIIVPDSREGWSRLLHAVLKSYFYTGKSFSYSTILLREFGAPLKSFGGTASGPGALIDGIADICKVMDNRIGKKLRSIDVLDICNIIGRVVVSGSSRRSAQIAIGDPDDVLFMRAKNWAKGDIPAWRANSNNSIYADSYEEIQPELWNGYDGSGEPYGLLNRKLARRVGRLGERNIDNSIEGFNPCAEIALGDGESCNLATIFLPAVESQAQMFEISRLLYLCQKTVTQMDYPYDKTTKIVAKNSRIGQSITGVLQATQEQLEWLDPTYVNLRALDEQYSEKNELPKSVRLTTIQPSGTLSLLPGVTPGVHPAFAPYYVRRVRFNSGDPLVTTCRERGYPVKWDIGLDGREDHTKYVVEFPCMSPEGSTLASDMTAIDQLEWVKLMQTDWADNAVSVTVYYRVEELDAIKAWLERNYDKGVKSVSFLLHSDHNFALAPYEEITKEEYDKMVSRIDMSVPLISSGSEEIDFGECEGGACPVK